MRRLRWYHLLIAAALAIPLGGALDVFTTCLGYNGIRHLGTCAIWSAVGGLGAIIDPLRFWLPFTVAASFNPLMLAKVWLSFLVVFVLILLAFNSIQRRSASRSGTD